MRGFPIPALFVFLLISFFPNCRDKSTSSSVSQVRNLPPSWRASLVFYRIPRCFLCEELAVTVDALENEYRAQIHFDTVDYHIPSCQEAIRRHGLGSHGIVIASHHGETLWKLPAHEKTAEQLVSAVQQVAAAQAAMITAQ